jgi:AcrR family transcriptional regulator
VTESETISRRHPPLNREAILDGAIALIERDGPEALSMRKLGASLGVEGMAIYHHFSGREDLLAGLAGRLLRPLGELELGSDWRGACRAFATGLREVAVARPATFKLVAMEPLPSDTLGPVERLLEVLIGAGFDPGSALAIYRATVSYARGYALAEATGFTVDAAGPGGLDRLLSLSAEDFPILAGRAAELIELDADQAFELGLRALLTGLDGPRAGRES